MAKLVKVSFKLEPSDSSHSTGMTQDHFDEVSEALSILGADDIEFELVEEDE